MLMKRKLKRQFGTSRALLHTYFAEFMWRRRHLGHNYFSVLLVCINESYPLMFSFHFTNIQPKIKTCFFLQLSY